MPIKFKPTAVTVARGSTKKTTVHYYMKCTPLKELIEEFNKTTLVKGKCNLNQKLRNQLVRRVGVDMVLIKI